MKTLIYSALLILITACGAASNSDREDSPDNDNGGGDRNSRTFTDEEARAAINTQVFRDLGAPIYSYEQEATFNNPSSGEDYPSTLSPIPSKGAIQDEVSKRPSASTVECGHVSTFSSISNRLGDCAAKNSNDQKIHLWNAVDSGVAGESNWRLVARTNISNVVKSVWQDQRTGLLWSDNVASADWEKASSNASSADQVCNGSNTDFSGIDSDEVVWRLPTRGDYLQADLNGARFALSSETAGDPTVYWTANFAGAGKAWAIKHNTGELSLEDINTNLAVRCVGIVIK